jgi:hypothetical protein
VKLFQFFNKKKKKTGYTCSCCGKVYDEVPLCFGSQYPDYYFSVPLEERSQRIDMQQSLCVIDNEHCFHRGRITIPIIDYTENLVFDIWTSISADNFNIRVGLWEDPKRVEHEPYFGWLQSIVPTYGNTINIKTIAVEQTLGLIPEIKVIEEGHPLQVDQEKGISFKKALEIVDNIMRVQHQNN